MIRAWKVLLLSTLRTAMASPTRPEPSARTFDLRNAPPICVEAHHLASFHLERHLNRRTRDRLSGPDQTTRSQAHRLLHCQRLTERVWTGIDISYTDLILLDRLALRQVLNGDYGRQRNPDSRLGPHRHALRGVVFHIPAPDDRVARRIKPRWRQSTARKFDGAIRNLYMTELDQLELRGRGKRRAQCRHHLLSGKRTQLSLKAKGGHFTVDGHPVRGSEPHDVSR